MHERNMATKQKSTQKKRINTKASVFLKKKNKKRTLILHCAYLSFQAHEGDTNGRLLYKTKSRTNHPRFYTHNLLECTQWRIGDVKMRILLHLIKLC